LGVADFAPDQTLEIYGFDTKSSSKMNKVRVYLKHFACRFQEKKTTFFLVFRTKSSIPNNKVQDPKIKYKSQNFEACTLFFALNFIDSYPVRWLWRDPRIKSTPTLCFSTSGTHRTLVKSYRHIAPAKSFQIHIFTLLL
jgi:hypothetical protein